MNNQVASTYQDLARCICDHNSTTSSTASDLGDNFLTNVAMQVKLDVLYQVCEMAVRMTTKDVMTRRRAKLVEWTATRHCRGDVANNSCYLGFRTIGILPDTRTRHLYFAVALEYIAKVPFACIAYTRTMRGTAATVGIMDRGEINDIARNSSNHSFLAGVAIRLTWR